MNILVLCTGNSARSILLEAILRASGAGRVQAFSAGSQPAGQVNRHAIDLLTKQGHETAGFRSKSWDEFGANGAPEMALVITVCGSAAEEVCPIWPGAPVQAHWGVEDPAALPDEVAPAGFAEAYGILQRRAAQFLAQPIEQMTAQELKAAADAAGRVA